jgi:hypothetical protein
MSGRACAEKKSCRWLFNKTRLMEEDFCSPCEKTIGLSTSYLATHTDLWKGVCHRLKNDSPMNDGSAFAQTSDGSRLKRSYKQTDRFVAEPSRGQMQFQRAGKKLHASIIRKIRNDPDPAIDRAYAERCITKENQEKENTDPKSKKLAVALPNGGKSKSARSKQNRTLGAVFNQMTKAFARNKATPNRYRAEGIKNALSQAPDLSNPATNGKSNDGASCYVLSPSLILLFISTFLQPSPQLLTQRHNRKVTVKFPSTWCHLRSHTVVRPFNKSPLLPLLLLLLVEIIVALLAACPQFSVHRACAQSPALLERTSKLPPSMAWKGLHYSWKRQKRNQLLHCQWICPPSLLRSYLLPVRM